MGLDIAGHITEVTMEQMQLSDPFHAESCAMLQALRLVQLQLGRDGTKFFRIMTDCKVLKQLLLSRQIEETPNWRAERIVTDCIQIIDGIERGKVKISHVDRKVVQPAHVLANLAEDEDPCLLDDSSSKGNGEDK
jgi:Reverse transcriptase-like